MPTEAMAPGQRPQAPAPADARPIIALASESDRAAWDAYVSRRTDACGYHEWAWRDVLATGFGHQPVYLIARDASGAVRGVLPIVEIRSVLFGRTMTSLPFVNYGGVLADDDEVARALVDAGAEQARARRCAHLELRHIAQRFSDLPCKQHKVTMRLPIEAGMWERLDRKVRNQVRKAEKSNLTVTRGGAELVGDFYTVFTRNMRDLGTPVYARRLFDDVLRRLSRTRAADRRAPQQSACCGGSYIPDTYDGRDPVGLVHSRLQQLVSESLALLARD